MLFFYVFWFFCINYIQRTDNSNYTFGIIYAELYKDVWTVYKRALKFIVNVFSVKIWMSSDSRSNKEKRTTKKSLIIICVYVHTVSQHRENGLMKTASKRRSIMLNTVYIKAVHEQNFYVRDRLWSYIYLKYKKLLIWPCGWPLGDEFTPKQLFLNFFFRFMPECFHLF